MSGALSESRSAAMDFASPERVAGNRWLFILLGIVLILVGGAAIANHCFQFLITFGAVLLYGWVLIFSGAMQIIAAVASREWSGFLAYVLFGILSLVVGFLMVAHPMQGALILTLLLGAYFFVEGVFRVVVGFTCPYRPRAWMVLSGLVDVALGTLLMMEWPGDSLFVIGLFIGINLLFCGALWLALGLSVSPPAKQPAAA